MIDTLTTIAIAVVSTILVVWLIGLTISRVYKRATKEVAFVRTGLGGEKVCKDGAIPVIGWFHDLIYINMNTMAISISREKENALITKDRIRADVIVDFYLKVQSTIEGISTAAQTLGAKTQNPSLIKDLVEAKFVDCIRAVASEMNMEELHESRAEFVQRVQAQVSSDLEKNGLELESVSLTNFDQTDLEYFDSNNAFDAQGRQYIEQIIQTRRKETNDIQQKTRIEIEERDFQAVQRSLQIDKDTQLAKQDQELDIARSAAAQESKIAAAKEASLKEREQARIESEKAVEEANIIRERELEVARQEKAIQIAEKSEAESAARAKAAEAEKSRVAKEEEVKTVREVAEAERAKAVAVKQAEQVAEEQFIGIAIEAQMNKQAAEDEAKALEVRTNAKAKAATTEAEANKLVYQVDADGIRAKLEAENAMSAELMNYNLTMLKVGEIANIITASVKPLEQITDIKILQGYQGGPSTKANGNNANNGNLGAQLTDAALGYRAQAPLVDAMIRELGIGKDLPSVVTEYTPNQVINSDAGELTDTASAFSEPAEAETAASTANEAETAASTANEAEEPA